MDKETTTPSVMGSILPNKGKKYDLGKTKLQLLEPCFLMGTAEVLTFGAQKYGEDNWKGGIDDMRIYGSIQRHLVAWRSGQIKDDESGLSHLAHVGAELMFLMWGEEQKRKKLEEEMERKGVVEYNRLPKFTVTRSAIYADDGRLLFPAQVVENSSTEML